MDAEMVARLELLQLEGSYGRLWDLADAEGWARLFTSDGVFEVEETGSRAGGVVVRGTDGLEDFCRKTNELFPGLHLLNIPVLDITGDEARGWLTFAFHCVQGADVRYVAGFYRVRYERGAEGWRIAHRVERAVMRSSHAFIAGY